LPKFLIARRATTFGKVDYLDNQSPLVTLWGRFANAPTNRILQTDLFFIGIVVSNFL